MNPRQTFAALLFTMMGAANLSARALAKKIDCGPSRVSDWLRTDDGVKSRHYPEPARLPDVLRALSASSEDIVEIVAAYAHETGALPVVCLSRSTCRRLARRAIAAKQSPLRF
jgi:hypothetical protein